ncbi:unnamed protein product, partial [Larinioides sclopetarius]
EKLWKKCNKYSTRKSAIIDFKQQSVHRYGKGNETSPPATFDCGIP